MVLNRFFKQTSSSLFREHRLRVQNAKCKVDCRPPAISPTNLCKVQNVLHDTIRAHEISDGNRLMVSDMARYMRVGGGILENLEKSSQNRSVKVRLDHMKLNMKKIEDSNLLLAQRILNVKPKLDTGTRKVENLKDRKIQSEKPFKVPYAILNKYKDLNVDLNMDKKMLQILLRPKVYFDLTLLAANRLRKNVGKSLGRVVMQLYTEACPQVVLEFVRIFKRGITADMSILRLFPKLWLEAELSLKNSSPWINKPKIEYDMRAIDHGKSAGVLSFAKDNLTGFRYGVLNFAISFRQLAVCNGKRVGFGKVIQGQKIIDWVQIFGTKNGKPTRDIRITKCGVLQ